MEFSRCPELNQLFLAAQDYQIGAQTKDDVKQRLRHMEALYQMLWSAWQQQLRRHDKASSVHQEAETVDQDFRRLRRGLEEIRQWFSDQSPTHMANGLEESRLAMDSLAESFNRVAEKEQNTPALSQNPVIHEVLRVADLVYAGKLGHEVLADVLARVRTVLKQTGQMVFAEEFSGEQGETQKQARRLMDRIYAAVKQAEACLADKQMDALRKALDAARVATDELHELRHRTEAPPEPPEPRACWRCSEMVPGEQMTCQACGFRFPNTAATSAEPLPVEAQVVLRTPAGHTPTEVSERLSGAVEDVQEGGSQDALWAAVQDARSRLVRARRELDTLSPPLGEDAALMEEGTTMLQEGLVMMEQGLNKIADYKTNPDRDVLAEGLEMYLLGNDQLMALQAQEQESTDTHGAF